MALSQLTRKAMRTNYGNSRYTPAESDFVCMNTRKAANKPALVIAHPRASNALGMFSDPAWVRLYQDLCEEYVLCIADCGGNLAWGNQGTLNSIGAQITHLRNNHGAAASLKAGLLGISMGGLATFNYAKANPTAIGFVAQIAPATNLQDLRLVSSGAYASEIDTAYGGSLAGSLATFDPYTYRASYPAIMTGIWSSAVDVITRPEWHQAMKDAKPLAVSLFDIRTSAGISPPHEQVVPWAIEGIENAPYFSPKVADWCNARRYDSF